MPAELHTREPRPKPAPYVCKSQADLESHPTDAPPTSVKSIKSNKHRDNLTLHDWLTMFSFIDSHPNTPQEYIVVHFKTLQKGALEFMLSMLSQKLRGHAELEQHANSHRNALSGKHPRAVTSPEVDKALVLWVRSMEEKGETVNGPMLCEKQK
ncbi:hypothetical protein PAXRUDRAFT_797483 [Paxillus rubicundulus Ve08.2h10]|uniref:HTH CENPB-type domain-containing protein n=1 Tax=Paxillus rubicundulus Ve08.2h10 TaxID=930991 RepID=A0A0D0DJZ8_9AGAM|nr:hypothetical protein PAXRUDRAFT_797483 [Paxillus rubicundulus Ve08.2h10]